MLQSLQESVGIAISWNMVCLIPSTISPHHLNLLCAVMYLIHFCTTWDAYTILNNWIGNLLICLLRLSFRQICSFRLKPRWRISVASWNSIKWCQTGQSPCIKLANNYWLIRYCNSCRCESLLCFFLSLFCVWI